MSLLVGTRAGAYRYVGGEFTQVTDGLATVARPESLGPVIAVGSRLLTAEAPPELVFEAPRRITAIGEVDGRATIGTAAPAALYVTDDGESWTTVELPARGPVTRHGPADGTTVTGPDGPPVATIAAIPSRPDWLVVGLEGDGVLVSRDRGTNWRDRSRGLGADVHELRAVATQEWVAATGNGAYRTRDAGRTWVRLDTSQTYQQYTYFHGLAIWDGRVVVGGGAHMPGGWEEAHGASGLLARLTEAGLVNEPYPGAPKSIRTPSRALLVRDISGR
ncbi:MAG: WD40/YVTN/BNR-like repeat-containing protein [Halobacteriaceae archaeon]